VLSGLARRTDSQRCQFHGGPVTQSNLTEENWMNRLQQNNWYEVDIIRIGMIDKKNMHLY
jgi:hypothetical protein